MPRVEPLTPTQRAVIRSVLAEFADKIDRVDIYGSRARGTHRPGSDVDLAITGSMTPRELARLAGAFEESRLSLFVDAHLTSDQLGEAFERAVAADAWPLFTNADLIADPVR